MIFLQYNSNGDITLIHYRPMDPKFGLGKTEDELRVEGLLVDSLPEPEHPEGKEPVLKVNTTDLTLYYEYVDRPLTPEEKVQLLEQENQELKNRIDLMQQALDDLLLGGM